MTLLFIANDTMEATTESIILRLFILYLQIYKIIGFLANIALSNIVTRRSFRQRQDNRKTSLP